VRRQLRLGHSVLRYVCVDLLAPRDRLLRILERRAPPIVHLTNAQSACELGCNAGGTCINIDPQCTQ
jgi:hypothetical protein